MKRIILIGNGMVGYKFCELFAANKHRTEFSLMVFGGEKRPAYDRVHLSAYFSSRDATALELAPESWYEEQGIALCTNTPISRIDRAHKKVYGLGGASWEYDILVLATGSRPFVPPVKGVEKKGVFVYRTLEDLEQILEYASQLQRSDGGGKAAILGGGLLGLEAGKATMDMGMETHIVEFASKLMPRQLDERSSNLLQLTLESMGIHIHLNRQTAAVQGDERVSGLAFADGSGLETDMLIISAGIRPVDELARDCGLTLGQRGGVVVDDRMQTSDKDIYAIGEVALYREQIYGLVAPGYEMARVAIDRIMEQGERSMPESIDMSTKLKLMGVDVASFGQPFITSEEGSSLVLENKKEFLYKRINISNDGKKLLGGILVGDATDYNRLHQMYLNGLPVPEHAELLLLDEGVQGNTASGSVLDLPDEARICSCEGVSKGVICDSIAGGSCNSMADVVTTTGVTTGCGGCKPMVAELVGETLRSLGKQVKADICEHFAYTRQELFQIISVKGWQSFDQVLDHLGKGDGCEICKPVVASVLASIYNETPNREEVIQDSNDRFLANIQRNGTYSVVPRIPGGEITPEKLIVLGEVAKEYGLYTKITGGQRIDLFGAELNDLPDIWKKLIDAGFESGHAYGKALRTVKSCVGSTWCRYGMDESVSFAIALEERYKGLRAPHKIKGGVSGCIRECAEARGKDFGVIAVEGGWNLYVCGNGGATPKHAQLLAEQIDGDTVISYLDRFLMFYIRTAAPLMRTAAWLDKLEGGIDELKQIVVADSLGLGAELEEQMQGLVDKYVCEWKEAVEKPGMKKRFSHFANSEERDDNLVFVPLREQKMPQPWK